MSSFTADVVGAVLIWVSLCSFRAALTAALLRALALVLLWGRSCPSRVALTAATICALALVFTIVGGLVMLVALSKDCS